MRICLLKLCYKLLFYNGLMIFFLFIKKETSQIVFYDKK